ncbi:MAG: lipoyl(octanoyl) transferase LipB [Alphaproteobacteria bacterium]|nr:lipoyl(octanoyl) transferase LipB [Alphaproteobacteria bacterium]
MNESKLGPVERPVSAPVEWRMDAAPVDYKRAIQAMDDRVAAIHAGTGAESVWLLEHPSLYTAGTSAKDEDLTDPDRFPVYRAGRGGQYTYHGPGQRIAYVMLDLKRRRPDVRWYVHALEEWIIRALASFNVIGERREGRVGIWVNRGGGREDKIAAIGVRIRHWITFHGIAINVEPDLTHFSGIVPCGIGDENLGVTSLVDLGLPVVMADLDDALRIAFDEVFGETR